MKKKRRRRISVLLIPDDNAEPYSFRLSWMAARLLMLVGTLLLLHIILGVVGYRQYFKLRHENSELEQSNTRLLEDNKRVYRLAQLLEEMDSDQAKIMNLLGVEVRDGGEGGVKMSLVSNAPPAVESSKAVTNSESRLVTRQPAKESKGRFVRPWKRDNHKIPPGMPTLLPVEGFLTDEFTRSPWFPFDSHAGIDIAGKRGSVIVAAGDGQVIFAGWHNVFGNFVIIHHGNDLFSRYGHNDRLLVRENQYVKRGDPIALLGSSGMSTGPHLHFEIWKGGKAMDPRQYLLAFRDSNL